MNDIEIKVIDDKIELHDSEGLAGTILIDNFDWNGRMTIVLTVSTIEEDIFIKPNKRKSVRLYL